MLDILDMHERSLTGPVMKSDEFDMEFAMKIRDVVKKNGIEYNENELVAFARVFSDDVFATHITDIVVGKGYQGKGIGRRMMKVIINKYGHTGIYVDAFKSGGRFYEKLGFKRRTHMEIYSRKFA